MHHADAAKDFHDAIAVLDLKKALEAGQWLKEATGELRLGDSLDLLILMIWKEDHRAERAGDHWLERLTAAGAGDSEIQVAAAAIEGMKVRDSRLVCERVLRTLSNAPRLR